ncbi:hypothetical protein U5A82_00410 [Sphingobium sp. CR2-8]|uniref:hypothetical protein n=1 Tax=Sphingobium sp. CR2-8 TaxID=1306534 RepID=UPI002DBCBAB6|nr:hypothetical protein [Sphingobium sp. CR2-8]MEC3908990.1 hypothetical protein [Sphingobium sp. CR2-8]
MAYIDFAQPLPAAGDGIALSVVHDRIKAIATGFSPTEWQIVQLARRDGLASLRGPGAWTRFKTLVFGPQPHFQLANARLEALRRLAVEGWHHGFAVRPSSITAFRDAGFSEGQVELLLSAITSARHRIKGKFA